MKKKYIIILSLLGFLLVAPLIILSCLDQRRFFYFPKKATIYNIGRDTKKTVKEYNIPVGDNQNIKALIIEQKQPQSKTLEGYNIFFFHGGGGNIDTYSGVISNLTDFGARVFCIDWRGYGRSTGVPNHINVLKDSRLFINKFLKKEEKNKNIFLGLSLGGQIASVLGVENKDKINKIILFSPVTQFSDLAYDVTPGFLRSFTNYEKKFYCTYSTKKSLKHTNIPILLVGSEKDEIVPIYRLNELYDTFNSLNSEFLVSPVDGHLQFLNEVNEDVKVFDKVNLFILKEIYEI